MLNTFQNVVIIVLTVTASLLFMWGLNRIWPWEKRRAHNDLIGWQLSILGTTYAVILGFMLYTVWTNFGAAELNAENEANALGNLYRLAAGLPDPQRGQVEVLARSYAETVIDQDWPQMAADHSPESSHKVNQDMWRTLMSIETGSPTEIIAEDHALSELSALTDHRRIRFLQNASRLPTVLWCLLVIGGTVTIASASMFGSANTPLHALGGGHRVTAFVRYMKPCQRYPQGRVQTIAVNSLAFFIAIQGTKMLPSYRLEIHRFDPIAEARPHTKRTQEMASLSFLSLVSIVESASC